MLDEDRPTWSFEEARDRLKEVVNAALAGAPQTVTRDGTPAVVVLRAEDFDRLQNQAAPLRKSFEKHLLSFPQSPEGDQDFVIERLPFRMRDVEF